MCKVRGKLLSLLMITAFSVSPALAALPDWSGEWQIVGLRLNSSGLVETALPDLLAQFGEHPPDTPEGEAKLQTMVKAFPKIPLRAACQWGFPMVMLESPLYFEVVVSPKETAMIFSEREIRHIYTDGRAQPSADELWPTYWGSSVGHWEGPILVVETVSAAGIAEKVGSNLIFVWNGSDFMAPIALLSFQARYVERIRLVSPGLLEDQMTIYDPQLAKPWLITHRYQHVPSITRMVHEECEGDDRNPVVNGQFTLK
jgi:hypothetical protein